MCFCLDKIKYLNFLCIKISSVSVRQRKHSFTAVKATMFGPHCTLPFSPLTTAHHLRKTSKWEFEHINVSITPLSWNIIVKGSTLAAGFQAPTHSHLVIYMTLHYRLAAKVTEGPKRQNETDLVMKAFKVFTVVILTLAFLLAVAPNKVCRFGNAKHSQRVGHTLVYSAFLPGSNSQHHSIHLCPEWKRKCNHHRGCSQPLSGLQINQAAKHSSRLCDASSRTFIRFHKLIQL